VFTLLAGLIIAGFVILDRGLVGLVDWLVRFWKIPVTLTFCIMCAGVSSGQTQSASESGIEGVISISPTKAGPIRADSPSSRPLANTAFVVENQTGNAASFTTDENGHFRMPLPPGHYKVSLKERRSSIGRYGPFEIDVVAGQITKVEWQCDSGIR
jgi:hypothetical protein